jgi:hypothetical protein
LWLRQCRAKIRAMSEPYHHPAKLPMDELLKECSVRTGRRRGPGGQHRNKTESAVVLRHEPTGIEGQAAERRSQAENHRVAVRRLRMNLALQVRSSTEGEAAPSDLWRSRCRNGILVCSAEHADFPALVAEALDVIASRNGHLRSSADQLGCTISQFVKFLGKEPAALGRVNEIRRQHGLPPRSV